MAGRLAARVDGRPVVIDADESGVTVTFGSMRAAWAARRSAGAVVPLLAVARRAGITVRLNVAGLVTLGVVPAPSGLLRIMLPELAALRR